MTEDLATWLLEQIAEDERRAYQALLGYPETADGLTRLEPALLTSKWVNSYHEVFQRMTQKPSPEWLERRQSIATEGIVYRWDKREKVADCGPANVYPARHIATWDPARVLAECDAKRRRVKHIADQLQRWRREGWHDSADREQATWGFAGLLKLEALPYVDRAGCLEAWKP